MTVLPIISDIVDGGKACYLQGLPSKETRYQPLRVLRLSLPHGVWSAARHVIARVLEFLLHHDKQLKPYFVQRPA